MDYQGFMEIVKSRRSVRAFKSTPVSDEMINQIIEAAKLAPTGNNTQPLEIVVVKEKSVMYDIESAIGECFIPPMTQRFNAPAMLAVLGDPRLCEGYPQGLTVREHIFHASLCLAIENMFLAMASLELGSVWKEVPPLAAGKIKDLLKIPQLFFLKVVLPLGFPTKELEPRQKRDIMVHAGGYDEKKFKSDEEIEMNL